MTCSLSSVNELILGKFNRKLVKLVEQFGLRKWSYISTTAARKSGKAVQRKMAQPFEAKHQGKLLP